MQKFTPEELKPSEKTLNLIRQVAYSYRAWQISTKSQTYYIN